MQRAIEHPSRNGSGIAATLHDGWSRNWPAASFAVAGSAETGVGSWR